MDGEDGEEQGTLSRWNTCRVVDGSMDERTKKSSPSEIRN